MQQIVVSLLIQLRTLACLRSAYVVTDDFHRDAKHGPEPQVASIEPSRNAHENGTNRFRPAQEENNYMSLDEDDSSARRRHTFNNGNAVPADELVDTNTYWQGMYFGVERIWVCDTVRLRLGAEDIENMMKALAEKNDVQLAEDRHKVDTSSSYVMYVKAIYKGAKAEVIPTDDRLRVAGDIYRVVEKSENGEDRAGPSSEDMSRKRTATEAFYEPERPFVDAQRKDRGTPKLPWMPSGFTLQRVNRKSVEVVCSVQQLSGRMYPSLVSNVEVHQDKAPYIKSEETLKAKARAERAKAVDAHEDSTDRDRQRLSLAGLISCAAKAMEVDTYRGLYKSREDAFRKARDTAIDTIAAYLEALHPNDAAARELADAPQPTESAPRADTSIDVGVAQKNGTERNGSASQPSRADPKAAGPAVSAPATALPVAASNPTEKAAAASTALAASNGSVSEIPSSNNDGPPLPPNWVRRVSKSTNGVYYANKLTKETRWDPPVA